MSASDIKNKKEKKQAHACDIPNLLGHPFLFHASDLVLVSHLASVDSVIILVRISASTFGFMRDSFLCMVHALLTATSEYARATRELLQLHRTDVTKSSFLLLSCIFIDVVLSSQLYLLQ